MVSPKRAFLSTTSLSFLRSWISARNRLLSMFFPSTCYGKLYSRLITLFLGFTYIRNAWGNEWRAAHGVVDAVAARAFRIIRGDGVASFLFLDSQWFEKRGNMAFLNTPRIISCQNEHTSECRSLQRNSTKYDCLILPGDLIYICCVCQLAKFYIHNNIHIVCARIPELLGALR